MTTAQSIVNAFRTGTKYTLALTTFPEFSKIMAEAREIMKILDETNE